MKKFFTCIAMLAAMVTASAQDTTPNRLLLNRNGMPTAYAIDRVDSLSFATVEGEVKAALEFKDVKITPEVDSIWVAVTKSEACYSYSIDVLPTNTVKRYDDETLARYFAQTNSSRFYDNFTNAALTGFETRLQNNTSYTVFTVAYDIYGVACDASRAEFTTPRKPTIGNPSVTYNIDETTGTSFTLTVTPNDDCFAFYWCQFGRGEAQAQFEQWGPMMGLANIESMIAQFSGFTYYEETTYTWDYLAPNTEYEVVVVPVDEEGTYGEMITIPVTTAKLGGTGVAKVDVEIGEFGGDATGGYYQYVTFTPNSETSVYHSMIMSKEYYDTNYTDESIKTLLTADEYPFGYNPNWNAYGVDKDGWEAEPGESYYALAMAKNINDEWGPLTKVEYTAPIVNDAPAAVIAKTPARVKGTTKKAPTRVKPLMRPRAIILSE